MWTYIVPNWLFFAIRVICVSQVLDISNNELSAFLQIRFYFFFFFILQTSSSLSLSLYPLLLDPFANRFVRSFFVVIVVVVFFCSVHTFRRLPFRSVLFCCFLFCCVFSWLLFFASTQFVCMFVLTLFSYTIFFVCCCSFIPVFRMS